MTESTSTPRNQSTTTALPSSLSRAYARRLVDGNNPSAGQLVGSGSERRPASGPLIPVAPLAWSSPEPFRKEWTAADTEERFFYSLTRKSYHAEDGVLPMLAGIEPTPGVDASAPGRHDWIGEMQQRQREHYEQLEFDRELDESRNRRRAATAGEPMPARWWERLEDCSPAARCESPFCGSCRSRSLKRQAEPKREAWRRAFDDSNADVWLVSIGRKGNTHSREGAMRFRAAVSTFDAALREVGAAGCFWVLEATDKRQEGDTDTACCDGADLDCPVCKGSGQLPVAHLHAHAVVVVPPGAFIDWSWLQHLSDPHQLDASWGTVDVQLGKRGRTPEQAFGYVTSYLSKRSTFQAAWLRSMFGRGGRTAWSTGEMRGKVKMRQRTTHTVDESGDVHPEPVHFIETTREFLVKPIDVGEIQHELESGHRSLPRRVYSEMVRWLGAKGIEEEASSGWVDDAESWEAMRGWEPKGKAVVQAQMWRAAHTTPSTGRGSSELKEISSSTDELDDEAAVPVDLDYLQRLGRETEAGFSARRSYG